jgi:para-aminobenzoate synthetase component 1
MKTPAVFELKAGSKMRLSAEELASKNEHCIILDSNKHQDPYGQYELLIAWGEKESIRPAGKDPLKDLEDYRKQNSNWLFGHLSFDLKNNLEDLSSRHLDLLKWPVLHFFVPINVIYVERGQWTMSSYQFNSNTEFSAFLKSQEKRVEEKLPFPKFKALIDKSQYLKDIEELKKELQFGSIYEINYCMAFEAKGQMQPYSEFKRLNQKHRAPFTAFYRQGSSYLLSFSPERYLRKRGTELISQPIKGTSPRSSDPKRDASLKNQLLESEKERAENVMIVDLVRNDLSRTAVKNSVSVPELFGLYSFKAVHQMISTVRSTLDQRRFSPEDAIRYSFPVGSMTGAPKISALHLINEKEHFRRGIYAGAVGYFNPAGDFDFNVVIRSLNYNDDQEVCQIGVGGAITIHCKPEDEYQECLLKAEKLIR